MAEVGDRPLLIRDTSTGGSWSSPEMTAYTNEDHLQAIIAGAPEHVPGVPKAPWRCGNCPLSPARPMSASSTRPGRSPWSNASWHRTPNAVAWSLVRSSTTPPAIWQSGPEAFHRQWSRQGGPDLEELDDTARERLDRNLEDGRIHLCLAVDSINADLRRLVEYLNRITRDDVRVTALQLAYARHGSI